jgi:hypothetical protein
MAQASGRNLKRNDRQQYPAAQRAWLFVRKLEAGFRIASIQVLDCPNFARERRSDAQGIRKPPLSHVLAHKKVH